MFDSLSEKLGGILDRLTRRGALAAADVDVALREVRRALLEADVALEVARGFIERVRERAVGVEVIKSVTPGQMVVKIVHDELVAMLGSEGETIDLNAPGGVRDYCQRYEQIYQRLHPSTQKRANWNGPVLDVIEKERRKLLPADRLQRHQAWRDRRLMALAAHKRRADKDNPRK